MLASPPLSLFKVQCVNVLVSLPYVRAEKCILTDLYLVCPPLPVEQGPAAKDRIIPYLTWNAGASPLVMQCNGTNALFCNLHNRDGPHLAPVLFLHATSPRVGELLAACPRYASHLTRRTVRCKLQ